MARFRRPRWLPRLTRRRALAVLATSLVVLLGATVAASATASPENPAPPTPTSSVASPTLDSPAPSTRAHPGASAAPCTGQGCIPRPTTSGPPPTSPGTQHPSHDGDSGDTDCGITNIGGCITAAINAFFRGIVTAALNPLLGLLSHTLLTTPTPDSLPRIGALWTNSWQILLASYGLLILIAGVLVMSYETLQTRLSVKEVAPRIVVGFLAGALSLWLASKAIDLANGLAQAVMGGGLDANTAGKSLKHLVLGSLGGGIFVIIIGLVLAGMLIVLLVTYIVRVALTVILIAGAPIALMFHALPQTEGVASWWWKAFGGCLAIQVCQSLTLITAMRVFLAPGGFTLFGPTATGLVNLLVALALLYILFKIPFWILSSVRGGGGHSLLGSLARGVIAYKTFGLLGGRGQSGVRTPPTSGGRGARGSGESRAQADPYSHTRATADGQYLLPLTGVRRTRHTSPAPGSAPAPKPRARAGRQLALPLGDDWPENKPVLGRDGQYRLPLDVPRGTPQRPSAPPTRGSRSSRRHSGQMELPFDPYQGNRPTRSGQYPLPLDVQRHLAPTRPPGPPTSGARRARRGAGHGELPFDPYEGNRAIPSGQYPLPLDGVHRVPRPPNPPTPPPPPPAPRRAPAGRQLRLPLDLPQRTRRMPPPAAPPRRHSGGTT